MKAKQERNATYLKNLMLEKKWDEINEYLGEDIRATMFEMMEFAGRHTPYQDDAYHRVARCLLILKGFRYHVDTKKKGD